MLRVSSLFWETELATKNNNHKIVNCDGEGSFRTVPGPMLDRKWNNRFGRF